MDMENVAKYETNLIQSDETGEQVSDENAGEICRLCGKKTVSYVPIFGKNYVAEKINRCLPIKVDLKDELPSNICKRCFHCLNISYKLLTNCIKVDNSLREKLTNEKKNKLIKSTSFETFEEAQQQTPLMCKACRIIFLDTISYQAHINKIHVATEDKQIVDTNHLKEQQINNVAVKKEKNLQPKCVPNIIRSRQQKLTATVTTSNEINATAQKLCEKPFAAKESQVTAQKLCEKPFVANEPQVKLIAMNKIVTNNHNVTILPNSVLGQAIPIAPESATIQLFTSGILANQNQQTIKIITTPFGSSNNLASSSLQLIPTSAALPINAKIAIPRIPSSNNNNNSNNSSRRVSAKAKKQETRPVEKRDHNYTTTNNENDSDELPLQDAPTAYKSVCHYYVQCKICGVGVEDDDLLIAHNKIHQPKKMGCKVCHQECDSLYDLYMHKKRNHNVYRRVSLKFSCEQCGKFFTNSWQWEHHEEHKCKQKFPMYPCKYCTSAFTTNLKLRRHLRKHKKEMLADPEVRVFKCVGCPKVFVDEEFYQKHRNVHDPECWDKYKCNICNRSFRDNVRLKEHHQSIHEGIKPHQCDICARTFHRRSNMKVHRDKHFARKCEHCSEGFLKLSELITHIKQVHKLEPDRKLLAKKQCKNGYYVCRFCGKKLSTHQSVLDHERIHTGEKPHECKTCGKTFRTYTARWAHVQRHKKGTFTCEHCGKVFGYKQNLLTHILIHMPVEERKHQCLKCGKKFLRKGHLNIHMRIHNGERPYTCDICNYSFTQMGDMKRHRARHSNGNQHVKSRKSRIKILNNDNNNDNLETIHQQLSNAQTVELVQNQDDNDINEMSNDLEYQINLIINQEEPVEEVVIHEKDC